MKEERCRACLSGHFRPTFNPNELKCNYCGWTRIAMNLGDYVAYRGKVDNFQSVNLWFLWPVWEHVMTWLKLWNMLHIIQVQNTVVTAGSICSLLLTIVLVVAGDCGQSPKKRKNDKINRSALNLGDLG